MCFRLPFCQYDHHFESATIEWRESLISENIGPTSKFKLADKNIPIIFVKRSCDVKCRVQLSDFEILVNKYNSRELPTQQCNK